MGREEGLFFGMFMVLVLVIVIFYFYCMWRIFEKAGRPGWEATIPIYNLYILITVLAKKEGWWLFLYFIPFVSMIISIIVSLEIAKNFGQSTAFGVGLALLSPIFYPILALGDAKFLSDNMEMEDNLIA